MTILNKNWRLRSSKDAGLAGDAISVPSYKPTGWIKAAVPGTVLGALTRAGKVPDMRVGDNIEKIPGFKGGMDLHTLRDMPADSPYRQGWWFRTVFTARKPGRGRRAWLHLAGINYRADVWVNGRRVGTSGHVRSQFRKFDIDVTRLITSGRNCVALEVFAPQFDDFGHTWIDWCPEPPDGSLGIFQPVSFETTGGVVIRDPYVETDLNAETLRQAGLAVHATLVNTEDTPAAVTLEANIGSITVREKVQLARRETRRILLTAKDHEALNVENPKIWWPWQLGKQHLYPFDLKVFSGIKLLHRTKSAFGIRKIESRLNRYGARQFTVNGRDMLLRGTAWSPDVFLEDDPDRDRVHLEYLKEMNQNVIRLEGIPVSRRFFDLCDKEGILVQHGITCVNWWEHTRYWREEDYAVARASIKSLFSVIRNHPSLSCFLLSSDFPCIPAVEAMYLDLLEEFPIGVPVIGNSAKKTTEQLGPTGMVHGPYDYVPPVFWYQGGAYHFNTECGPDGCIPELDSLQKIFPRKEQRHPGSTAWSRHCGLQLYVHTKSTETALEKRYGIVPENMERFGYYAQVSGYEGWRALYEAWVRNYPKATGVIGWMFNSAWPSLMWQMLDYYGHPLGAYYGSRKACEPLHVQYSYDDHSVWAVNQTAGDLDAAVARAAIHDLRGRLIWHREKDVPLKKLGRRKCFTVPSALPLPKVYFLVLELKDGRKSVSRNAYWLSSPPDRVSIVAKGDQWSLHKLKQSWADFRPLTKMKADVGLEYAVQRQGRQYKIRVALSNHPDKVAFFVWLRVRNRRTGERIVPAFWSDNGITLMPGERADVTLTIPSAGISRKEIDIDMVSGVR